MLNRRMLNRAVVLPSLMLTLTFVSSQLRADTRIRGGRWLLSFRGLRIPHFGAAAGVMQHRI
jgi:hypothetical protein